MNNIVIPPEGQAPVEKERDIVREKTRLNHTLPSILYRCGYIGTPSHQQYIIYVYIMLYYIVPCTAHIMLYICVCVPLFY